MRYSTPLSVQKGGTPWPGMSKKTNDAVAVPVPTSSNSAASPSRVRVADPSARQLDRDRARLDRRERRQQDDEQNRRSEDLESLATGGVHSHPGVLIPSGRATAGGARNR
jgi:hypothetical protein